MLVGYARVSSTGQSLDIQQEQLFNCGCEKIFSEKVSGRSTVDRDQLADALQFVREGDTLVVTRLDRLARSVSDLHNLIENLTAKGVSFKCLHQSGVDTDSSTGKLMLSILAAVGQFEVDLKKDRIMEGVRKAQAAGKYRGRKPTVDVSKVRELRAEGLGASQIARELSIGRASVYRALSV